MHHERGEFRQRKTAGPDLRTLPWVTQHGKPNGMFFGAELKKKQIRNMSCSRTTNHTNNSICNNAKQQSM